MPKNGNRPREWPVDLLKFQEFDECAIYEGTASIGGTDRLRFLFSSDRPVARFLPSRFLPDASNFRIFNLALCS